MTRHADMPHKPLAASPFRAIQSLSSAHLDPLTSNPCVFIQFRTLFVQRSTSNFFLINDFRTLLHSTGGGGCPGSTFPQVSLEVCLTHVVFLCAGAAVPGLSGCCPQLGTNLHSRGKGTGLKTRHYKNARRDFSLRRLTAGRLEMTESWTLGLRKVEIGFLWGGRSSGEMPFGGGK